MYLWDLEALLEKENLFLPSNLLQKSFLMPRAGHETPWELTPWELLFSHNKPVTPNPGVLFPEHTSKPTEPKDLGAPSGVC